MPKVKHFQVKPEHVEAIQFTGKNGKDICDWVRLFSDRYKVNCMIDAEGSVIITHNSSDVVWVTTKSDWVVRSFINSYFYVETDVVIMDQYIQL